MAFERQTLAWLFILPFLDQACLSRSREEYVSVSAKSESNV